MANSEGVKYTKKVDIWALGIILYHTVFECLPFSSVPGKYLLMLEKVIRNSNEFDSGGKNGRIMALASLDNPVDFPSIDNIDPNLLVIITLGWGGVQGQVKGSG